MSSIHFTKFMHFTSLLLLCFVFIRQQTTATGLACDIILNGYCYIYVNTPMNWYDAEDTCISMGGHLASIHSDAEKTALQSIRPYFNGYVSYAIIGCNDIMSEGNYSWTDGSDFSYTNWDTGRPTNDVNSDCCSINAFSDKWADYRCEDVESFICKVTARVSFSPAGPYCIGDAVTFTCMQVPSIGAFNSTESSIRLNGTCYNSTEINNNNTGAIDSTRYTHLSTLPGIGFPNASAVLEIFPFQAVDAAIEFCCCANISGMVEFSDCRFPIQLAAPPSAPTISLSSTYLSPTSCTGIITLTWLAVTSDRAVTSYEVLLNGTVYAAFTTPMDINSYSTGSLNPLEHYANYTVMSTSCAGSSIASSPVMFTAPTPALPSAPTSLSMYAYLSPTSCTGVITLTWLAVTSDRVVTSYEVLLNGTTMVGYTSTTTFTTGTLNLIEHYATYSVRAINCVGSGVPSSPVLFTPLPPPATPSAPIILTPPNITNLQPSSCTARIEYTLQQPADSRNVTSYHLSNGGTVLQTLLANPSNMYSFSYDVTLNSAENLNITVENCVGNSSPSLLTLPPVQGISGVEVSGATINTNSSVSFSLLFTGSAFPVAVYFAVDAFATFTNGSIDSSSIYIGVHNSGTSYNLTIPIPHLLSGTTLGLNTDVQSIYIDVFTIFQCGQTLTLSYQAHIDINATRTVPSAPTISLSSTYLSSSSCYGTITLIWLAVTSDKNVTSYEVLLNGTVYAAITTPMAINSYSTGSLNLLEHYANYTVMSTSCAGSSIASSSVMFTAPTPAPPSAPTNLSISSAYLSPSSCYGTITLTWLAVTSDRAVTSYEILLNGTVYATITTPMAMNTRCEIYLIDTTMVGYTSNTTFTTGTLNLLVHYANYTVRAINCVGGGVPSSAVIFTPLTTALTPAPPSAASISISTTYDSSTSCYGTITLTWLAVASDENVTSYEVLLNGTTIATLSHTAGTNTYTTSSLSLATFNGRYTVRAVSCAGSSVSNEVVFTPPTTPSTPIIAIPANITSLQPSNCRARIEYTLQQPADSRNVTSYYLSNGGTVIQTLLANPSNMYSFSYDVTLNSAENLYITAVSCVGNSFPSLLTLPTVQGISDVVVTGATINTDSSVSFSLLFTGSTYPVAVRFTVYATATFTNGTTDNRTIYSGSQNSDTMNSLTIPFPHLVSGTPLGLNSDVQSIYIDVVTISQCGQALTLFSDAPIDTAPNIIFTTTGSSPITTGSSPITTGSSPITTGSSFTNDATSDALSCNTTSYLVVIIMLALLLLLSILLISILILFLIYSLKKNNSAPKNQPNTIIQNANTNEPIYNYIGLNVLPVTNEEKPYCSEMPPKVLYPTTSTTTTNDDSQYYSEMDFKIDSKTTSNTTTNYNINDETGYFYAPQVLS